MPSAARTLTIDGVPDRFVKKCSLCKKRLARDQFGPLATHKDGLHSWCRRCVRINRYESYHTEEGIAKAREHAAREDVRKRRRLYDVARAKAHPGLNTAKARKYRSTPMGKLITNRATTRYRLKHATDAGSRAAAEALIALYDAEIARLAVREHELPDGPPRPRVAAGPPKPKVRAAYGSKSLCRGVHLTKEGTFKVKVSNGKGGSVHGGTYKTLDEAKAAANELGLRLLGVENYAVPRERP